VTVNEVGELIIKTASFIGAVGVICAALGVMLNRLLKPIRDDLRREDVRSCRMFLVGFLCDLENGIDKSEVEWQLAHEIYDHYTNDLKENSYVHDKWERVVNKAD
jgi:hypothetical protein